jgi:hypothetical protein
MGKKRISLEDLREKRGDIEQSVLRIRKAMADHEEALEKLHTSENKRMLSAEGMRVKEDELRQKTQSTLAMLRQQVTTHLGDSFDHAPMWTKEYVLRNARFSPEYPGIPGTTEAKSNALLTELIEDVRRGNAERRAARYSVEDLATELERAASSADVALTAVFLQEAKNRKLSGLEKLSIDKASQKLELPDIAEATSAFSDLDALVDETNGLLGLWREPRNEMLLGKESFHRFNRRKRTERFVKMIEAHVNDLEADRLQWQRSPVAQEPETKPPAEAVKKAETPKQPVIPLIREKPPAPPTDTPEPPPLAA